MVKVCVSNHVEIREYSRHQPGVVVRGSVETNHTNVPHELTSVVLSVSHWLFLLKKISVFFVLSNRPILNLIFILFRHLTMPSLSWTP